MSSSNTATSSAPSTNRSTSSTLVEGTPVPIPSEKCETWTLQANIQSLLDQVESLQILNEHMQQEALAHMALGNWSQARNATSEARACLNKSTELRKRVDILGAQLEKIEVEHEGRAEHREEAH